VRAPRVQPEAPPAATSSSAWTGFREFRVTRREFEDAAQTQCSFYLEPTDGAALPPFLPGQFLTFELKTDEARTITRCYSLSDRPLSAGYRVTIKRLSSPAARPDIPQGAASCHFHDRVHVGAVVRVRAPAGLFVIDADETVPAVLIAGGIGITPLLSMLLWCAREQPNRTIHLYYGVRSQLDHAFKSVLDELARSHPSFHLHVVYSGPGEGDAQGGDFRHEGRVDVDLLRRTLPNRRHQFYVCGPPPMMASLLPALEAWGIPKDDIRHEAFGPASVRAAASVQSADGREPIEIRFRRSGRTLAWEGEDANLLDFAERHGLAVESGCRSGSCGSCEVRVLSGAVRYPQKPDHDIAPGHCLLCVGTPASALEIEA
jgi:ferredoxin-NADP reductase